ncbi:carbohydrate ABC transporter permease [bacterium]|nr:carbohydrate ABC transporter permease [bacterium]
MNAPAAAPRQKNVDFGHIANRVALYAVLILFSVLFIFPFLWMLTTSFKELTQAMQIPPQWIPSPFRWQNYIEATQKIPFWKYAMNTLYLCVLCVGGTVVSCALAAYGFSRVNWRGRDPIFAASLATMMIPFPVLMVPMYSIFRSLGWVGTFMPLWVPAFFGSAYNIFLLRQFFMTIPKDLTEAAEIDGCGPFRTFVLIVAPLAKPAITVVALFTFMMVWNDFMGPLIYLTDQNQFTLALGLQHFQSKHGGTDMNLLMAASTLVVMPIVVLFFFTQRTFIEGIAMTGLKG